MVNSTLLLVSVGPPPHILTLIQIGFVTNLEGDVSPEPNRHLEFPQSLSRSTQFVNDEISSLTEVAAGMLAHSSSLASPFCFAIQFFNKEKSNDEIVQSNHIAPWEFL